MSDQFRTFQTVRRYEEALARHGQWLRWTQAITCPCVHPDTMQPDPRCSVCRGRGRIYRTPDRFNLFNEIVRHDGAGRVYPRYIPIVDGSVTVYRKGVPLSLAATQPADGSYVQLESPYPKRHEVITIDYAYSPTISVVAEDSEVYGTDMLRTVATRFVEKGKGFEGSIESVSRVYNVTKDETYTVESAAKEYIYLAGMGTWESGDVLEVDYVYVKPFDFMLTGVTGRLRYEQPYVLDDADAVLVTPYWAQPAPDDLFTAMAQERIGRAVIDPTTTSGNDVVGAFFDLSRLLRVIDRAGNDRTVGPGNDVEVYGRNELRWNVAKPSTPYVAQFTYHPTFTALTNLHTLRNSENKAFVNRVSVKQFDRVHDKVVY